jgi:hypoxanthine phosphoribosyltransferase
MSGIIYLDENQQETGIEHFLPSLQDRGIDTVRLKELINRFDFTGAPIISKNSFEKGKAKFDRGVQSFLDESSLETEEGHCLRGRQYYLDVILGSSQEVINAVIVHTSRLEELIPITEFSDLTLDESLLALSLLDHKRHFSLIALTTLYEHMLNNPEFPVEVYNKHVRIAKQDIWNYYSFLLKGSVPTLLEPDEGVMVLSDLDLPKDTERDSGASKLVFREMDHAGQLVLYAGNLLRYDGEQKIDAVVNPLFGAVEIGYALQSIFDILGSDKIGDVYFIKYSLHREEHPVEEVREIREYVAKQLVERLQDLKGKRIFIIDDMYNRGTTLMNLRDFFRRYSQNTSMATVEVNYTYHKGRGDLDKCLSPRELMIPPIADWRYVREIEREIQARLK